MQPIKVGTGWYDGGSYKFVESVSESGGHFIYRVLAVPGNGSDIAGLRRELAADLDPQEVEAKSKRPEEE